MHKKARGTIGETAIALELLKLGFNVFTEYGDLSKIDLIAEKHRKLFRIQVKSTTIRNNVVKLYTKKSGPNYKFEYHKDDIDFFAIYCEDTTAILWIPTSVALKCKNCMYIRNIEPKNNQHNVHMFNEFNSLERVLRDYTQDIQTDNAEDDDIAQTAMETVSEN